MMPAKNLVRMVMANTLRSPRHFILSAFGIVIGIGAFVLFLALTQRAGSVLEKVFPLEEVQVVAPRVSLLGKDASKRLDDTIVKTILDRPEVKSAIPRLNLAFPAAGRGSFEGRAEENPPLRSLLHCIGVRTARRPSTSRFSPIPISSP